MTRKKNGFLTFLCSLMPGAGEMYMGFMKQGITLMGTFFLIIFFASWMNVGALLYVLPVLWCYGFFHVHNLKAMPDEEFYALEDDYLFHLDQLLAKQGSGNRSSGSVLAGILVLVGVLILWENFRRFLRWILPAELMGWYWNMINILPQLVVAALLIATGIWLIRGKKRQLEETQGEEGHK